MSERRKYLPMPAILSVLLLVFLQPLSRAQAAQCLLVSSYHPGYAWSDGVERGLRETLEGTCKVTSFYMDTKHKNTETEKRDAALKAKQLIDHMQPEIVITADDSAAKYLIVPYYKHANLPIVFCGINWSVEEYGFPFSNVTGMIEVAAVEPMLQHAEAFIGEIKTGLYIGANTLTENKNLAHIEMAAANNDIKLRSRLSNHFADWQQAFRDAQNHDLVILGSNAGITDWDETRAMALATQYGKKLSITNHEWMMPYAMFGVTKVPEEQGEWAGKVAIEILHGTRPADIPIVPNRKFNMLLNKVMLKRTNISIPEFVQLKANVYP
jgi:ABC-type uncharacterized transport system substrate-binding protein